jgi:membrane protease YdiL (CAAX protease family)
LPTTVPATTQEMAQTALLAAVMLAVAAVLAWRAGVFRRNSIDGPVRLGGDAPAAPLFVVTVVGGAVWMLVQIAYFIAKAHVWEASHPGQKFDPSRLAATDFAIVAVVPALMGLIVLLIGDRFVRPPLHDRIGYGLSELPRGLLAGLIALPIVMPLMFAGSFVLEVLYRLMHYQHPTEHELLTVMKDAPSQVRWTLVLGATVMAPVFEEFLFRGHLQTLLARFFTATIRRPDPASDALPVLPVLDYAMPQAAPPPRRLTWTAVVITSLIFASVHPAWMAPLIFLLSLCLGYVYERTGSLWAPIVIHAAFNATSTVFFLTTR